MAAEGPAEGPRVESTTPVIAFQQAVMDELMEAGVTQRGRVRPALPERAAKRVVFQMDATANVAPIFVVSCDTGDRYVMKAAALGREFRVLREVSFDRNRLARTARGLPKYSRVCYPFCLNELRTEEEDVTCMVVNDLSFDDDRDKEKILWSKRIVRDGKPTETIVPGTNWIFLKVHVPETREERDALIFEGKEIAKFTVFGTPMTTSFSAIFFRRVRPNARMNWTAELNPPWTRMRKYTPALTTNAVVTHDGTGREIVITDMLQLHPPLRIPIKDLLSNLPQSLQDCVSSCPTNFFMQHGQLVASFPVGGEHLLTCVASVRCLLSIPRGADRTLAITDGAISNYTVMTRNLLPYGVGDKGMLLFYNISSHRDDLPFVLTLSDGTTYSLANAFAGANLAPRRREHVYLCRRFLVISAPLVLPRPDGATHVVTIMRPVVNGTRKRFDSEMKTRIHGVGLRFEECCYAMFWQRGPNHRTFIGTARSAIVDAGGETLPSILWNPAPFHPPELNLITPEQSAQLGPCSRCDVARGTLLCSRCRSVAYCSEECAALHWPWHRMLCVQCGIDDTPGFDFRDLQAPPVLPAEQLL